MNREFIPTARYLRQRAAHYRALADQELSRAKTADYLNRAQILETAIEIANEPAPPTPAPQSDIEIVERQVREGEEQVATQLALVEKLEADGHHEQSLKERESWDS